jgi:hypothetical protein
MGFLETLNPLKKQSGLGKFCCEGCKEEIPNFSGDRAKYQNIVYFPETGKVYCDIECELSHNGRGSSKGFYSSGEFVTYKELRKREKKRLKFQQKPEKEPLAVRILRMRIGL